MNREQATPYVAYVVDDAGCGRELGADPHAIVREATPNISPVSSMRAAGKFKYASRLVGWQCGFEPIFVAVHSYLDVRISDQEAEEMAAEYLAEIGWFSGERTAADYVL